MPKRRLGVALLVPPPWDREVEGLRRALGDGALGHIPPHVTLVPPVNVREDRVPEALAVLREAAAATSPITVELGPPATFMPTNPVLYLRVGGDGLQALRRLRDGVFRGPLDRDLTWPFEPHVTVADGAAPTRVEAALAALGDYAIEVTFDRVHLLEEGSGRIWRSIGEMAFAAPAVIGRGGLELELTTSHQLDVEAGAWSDQARGDDGGAPAGLAVTARRGGTVAGTATGWTRGSEATLDEVVVASADRGQGIGSHLLARFLAEAAERGATLARLHAGAGTGAEGLARARGWQEEARYPGPDNREIVQLVRRLGPPS